MPGPNHRFKDIIRRKGNATATVRKARLETCIVEIATFDRLAARPRLAKLLICD